jgi:hypothetical protein
MSFSVAKSARESAGGFSKHHARGSSLAPLDIGTLEYPHAWLLFFAVFCERFNTMLRCSPFSSAPNTFRRSTRKQANTACFSIHAVQFESIGTVFNQVQPLQSHSLLVIRKQYYVDRR